MFKSGFSILLIAVTLTSCSGINQSYTKLKIDRSIDLGEKTKDALDSELFVTGEWPKDTWWEIFDDEQLSGFIETGLKKNPSLASTEAMVRQANQEAFVVRSKLFPTINGLFNTLFHRFSDQGLGFHLPTVSKDFHLYNLALSFDYEFDFWKKNKYAYEAALGEARIKEAMHQQSRLVISTAIATEYFRLMSNMFKFQILEEIILAKARNLELVNLRKQNRIDNLLSLNSMKEEVVTMQKALTALVEEIKLEKSLLMILMGLNPAEQTNIKLVWDSSLGQIKLPKNIGIELMARRPDLIAAVWGVTTSAHRIGVAFAEFFPSIDLKMFGGFQSVNVNDLLKGGAFSPSIFPNISLPVFTGGRLRGNFKAKVAAYESSVYAYNEALLQAANEIVSGITRIESISEKLQYQNENLQLTKHNYDLVFARYKHGVDSMISVLQSDEKYLWTKYSQVDLTAEKLTNTVKLIQALGGGYIANDAVEALNKTVRLKKVEMPMDCEE